MPFFAAQVRRARDIGILLSNIQRRHRTLYVQKDTHCARSCIAPQPEGGQRPGLEC